MSGPRRLVGYRTYLAPICGRQSACLVPVHPADTSVHTPAAGSVSLARVIETRYLESLNSILMFCHALGAELSSFIVIAGKGFYHSIHVLEPIRGFIGTFRVIVVKGLT